MQSMRGFAVTRLSGNDNRKHLLSLVSPTDLSVIEDVELPFDEGNSVDIGSCGRLLYFLSGIGKIVVWDSATKAILKIIPAPLYLPTREGCPGWVKLAGLGYDAKSRDYKVLRHYVQCYDPLKSDTQESDTDTDTDTDEDVIIPPLDHYSDLYSFKCGTWKKLKTPVGGICPLDAIGLYLVQTGRCYWTGSIPSLPDKRTCVVSFDFASETFHHFSFPPMWNRSYLYKLVEFHGLLGIIFHSLSSPLVVDLYARRDTVWDRFYAVSLDNNNVQKPLDLKDDRLLFLSAKLGEDKSGLVVYDLVTKTSKKLDISSSGSFLGLRGISYAETTGTS